MLYRIASTVAIAVASILVCASARAGVSLGYFTEEYFSGSDTNSSGQFLYPSLKLAAQGELKRESIELGGDLRAQLTLNRPELYYINPMEAWIGTGSSFPSPVSFSFGRKKHEWSRADEAWATGLWQPRFRWDPISPDSVGLTGLFASYDSGTANFTAFGSPVFIPESGASSEIKDGKFRSFHPFFSAPPSLVKVLGTDTRVRYAIGPVKLDEIVLNPSVSLSAGLGSRAQGVWSQASYAYKAINQLILGYEGYLFLDSEEIKVTAHPRVLYHHLGAVEGGYSRDRFRMWASLTGENPARDETPREWTTQELAPAWFAASGIGVDLWKSGAATASADLGYIRSWGGFAPDQGPLAPRGASAFSSRVPFRDAASLGLKLPVPVILGGSLRLSSKLVHDFSIRGTLLSSELGVIPGSGWSMGIGADILAAGADSAPGGGAEHLHTYRAHDRIRGGVSYAF